MDSILFERVAWHAMNGALMLRQYYHVKILYDKLAEREVGAEMRKQYDHMYVEALLWEKKNDEARKIVQQYIHDPIFNVARGCLCGATDGEEKAKEMMQKNFLSLLSEMTTKIFIHSKELM